MTSAFGSGPKGKHAVVLEADYSAIGTAEEARTMVRDLVEDAFAQVTIHGV